MQRAKFERACGGGQRFVIFGPWIERQEPGLQQLTIIAMHAEAMPYDLMLS